MRYITSTIAAFTLASAVGAFAQEQAPAQPPPTLYHESWAVIIGIDNYQKWPKLEYAVNDANGMKEILLSKFRFNPDHVIITDSWNFKPLLAEAVREYPYILRLQAMECICPLNNVRLLPLGDGQFGQCRRISHTCDGWNRPPPSPDTRRTNPCLPGN